MNQYLLCLVVFAGMGIKCMSQDVPIQKSTKSIGLAEITLENTEDKVVTITDVRKYTQSKAIRFSGYARAFLQYRHMQKAYEGIAPKLVSFNGIDVKDDQINPTSGNNTGYPEPLIYLKAEANPSTKTSLQVEYYFDNQLVGSNTRGRVASLYRTLQFTGTTTTDIGDFKMIAGGGVNWYQLSPFTLWGYEYRDDMFERYPWEPDGNSSQRYDRFYVTQNIPRDMRWGNTGTQGFILEVTKLPLRFDVTALYGKTDNTGSFTSFLTNAPLNMFAGRIGKSFGRNKIGFNSFDQFGYTDQRAQNAVKQKIITGDLRLNFDKVKIYTEAGIGVYKDPIYDLGTSEALNFQADFSKKATGIPLVLQLYSVGKSVININSITNNSAHPNLQQAYGVPETNAITSYPGFVPEFGQVTNNRRGGYLKGDHQIGKLVLTVGFGASQEIENLFDQVTIYHRLNAFTRSRFAYFQNNVGPYNRILSGFRRTFEKLAITDSGAYKKGYNVIDLSLKYKLELFGRPLIVSSYSNYNSVEKGFSIIPQFTDKSFYRTLYQEFMAFYNIHPKVTLIGLTGLERVQGNMQTALATNGKPVDQLGHGYGLGFDYNYSTRAGLYLRHRWFDHRDKNFVLDRFNGQETSLEIKIFF